MCVQLGSMAFFTDPFRMLLLSLVVSPFRHFAFLVSEETN